MHLTLSHTQMRFADDKFVKTVKSLTAGGSYQRAVEPDVSFDKLGDVVVTPYRSAKAVQSRDRVRGHTAAFGEHARRRAFNDGTCQVDIGNIIGAKNRNPGGFVPHSPK